MSLIRLNKALASAGLCSRREADRLILRGAVAVNGVCVPGPGLRINPVRDIVAVDGVIVALTPDTKKNARSYILLHKPVQVISTVRDPQGRKTVLDLLPSSMHGIRVYPAGRLDYFSEGLILLTNDGELVNRLMHPRYHLPRTYEVLLREKPPCNALARMRAGMVLAEGECLAPVQAKISPNNPCLLLLILHQGVNRQIRRMCRDLGLTILMLRRLRMGPLVLGSLPKGQCRELSTTEVDALKKITGMSQET